MGEPRRIGGIELFRIIAAAAVVWIHTAESESGIGATSLCRFAVPFFTATLTYFTLRPFQASRREASWTAFSRSRFQRVYLPFLIWSLFYLILRNAKHLFSPESSEFVVSPTTLLNGTTHHLWFLPFALIVSMLLFPTGLWTSQLKELPRRTFVFLCLITGVLISRIPYPGTYDPISLPGSYFLLMSWETLPAVFFAIVVTEWLTGTRSKLWFLISSILFCVSLALMLHFGSTPLLASLSGCFALILGLHFPEVHWPPLVYQIASVTLGIYLVHVAFVEGLQFLFSRSGISVSLMRDSTVFLLSMVGSIAVSLFLSRLQKARFLVQ